MPLFRLGPLQPEVHPSAWIAPNAVVCADVRIGANATIWWNTVVRGDSDRIVISAASNIQDHSMLHTDKGFVLTVGIGVTVGHRVTLHGCTVGDGALIGMGSIVMNGAVIGRESIVGAGALIPEGKIYPERVLILGSPGRVVRELTEEEVARLKSSAQHYVVYGQRYATECTPLNGG